MHPALDIFGLTDQGRVRARNEDHFVVAELRRSLTVASTSLDLADRGPAQGDVLGILALVADGMGGHAGGETASRTVTEAMLDYSLGTLPCFYRLPATQIEDLRKELVAALRQCGQRLREAAADTPEEGEMGTTLTLVYVVWPEAYVLHVGDSRCYLHRRGILEQVTKDHTYAQQLIDEGLMTAEQARGSNWDNTLWNVVGTSEQNPTAELHHLTLRPGDTVLLCSDGLTKHVATPTIQTTLAETDTSEAAARSLIGAALSGGGTDNVTVIVIKVPEGEDSDITSIFHDASNRRSPLTDASDDTMPLDR